MSKIKDLFSEYYSLSYYPGQKPRSTKDIRVKDYMILRTSGEGWNILNLWNGTSILIDHKLIDFFIGLNIWGGARFIGLEPEDKVERFIQQLLILVGTAERRDMEKFLMVLGDLLGTGTTEFREWVNSETGEKFSPIEINSLDKFRSL